MKASEYIESLKRLMADVGDVDVKVSRPTGEENAYPYFNRRLNSIIVAL